MPHLRKRQHRLRQTKGLAGHFSGYWPFADALHAGGPCKKPASGHPDIGERKRRDELCGVLRKARVAHFDVSKLTFDHPKRMLHLGPHTGLELFGLFVQRAPERVLLRLAFARTYGHMPIHASGCGRLLAPW